MGYHDYRGHVAQDKEENKDVAEVIEELDPKELCEDGCCDVLCRCEGECNDQ